MENLKDKTAKGIAWGAINNGVTQTLNLVFGIFLGRLLNAEDYGIIAVLTIFSTLAGCLQSAGFSQALANIKKPTQGDYNAVAWFNILVGCSMYFILFLCAPIIADFFNQPRIVDVSRIVFLTIPLSAIAIVPNAILWIEMRNKEQAIAGITALFISGCCGIWMAWHGYGYWSLAWQQVIYITVVAIMKYCFTRWIPILPVDFTPIKRMFKFSSKLLITSILTVISQNVLTFIFGKLLPIITVGQFNQANKWNTMGASFITSTIAQVAQPVFTNVNDDKERRLRIFRKMLRFTSFISFPLMFGLVLVAREFITITVGEKWLPCVPLLQILCIGGAFIPIQTLYQNFIISRGRSDTNLYLMTAQIVSLVGISLLFASKGIIAMVIAFSLLNIIFTIFWHFSLSRIQSFSFFLALKDVAPFALIAGTCMIAVHLLTVSIDHPIVLILLRIIIAIAIYYVIMKLLHAKTMEDCINYMIKKEKT